MTGEEEYETGNLLNQHLGVSFQLLAKTKKEKVFMKRSWLLFMSLTCSLFAVYCPLLWAEEKVKIEEVVVTASRIEEAIEEPTSEIAVISSEDIKKMNVEFLPEVLRKVPDISLIQSGGDGRLTSVFLRGGDSKHTLVMIDGVKANSNTTGGFDFSGIPVEDIERVEILKGSQSTIYGSEAVAGVINIITKKGEGKLKVDISFEGGSHGTYNPSLTVSGSEKALNYRFTAQYFHTDGISAAKNGSEKDSYENTFFSWKLGHKPSGNMELEITGNYYNDIAALDGYDFMTGLAADDMNYVQHGNHFMLSGRGKLYLFDKWEQVLTVSTFMDSLKFRDPDTAFNNYDIINKRNIIDWQNNLYLSNSIIFTAGLEYRKDSGENTGNFNEAVENKAAYLNSKFKLLRDALIINAGLRYDDHQTAGSKTTYKVGAAYNFKENGLIVRASYGTGFSAPSFNDLYFPFYGNQNLKPEESKAFEAGVVKTLFNDKISLSLAYFSQEYWDMIQADPLTYTAANIARASVRGIESNFSFRLTDSVDMKAGYTYLDTENKDTGTALIRRPKNKVNLSLGYTANSITLLADYIYVDSRLDSSAGNEMPSYSIVNLSGSYKAQKNITLFSRIENLFDKGYEEARGYGTKGISVYGGVRAAF